jgi:hypothetical protein
VSEVATTSRASAAEVGVAMPRSAVGTSVAEQPTVLRGSRRTWQLQYWYTALLRSQSKLATRHKSTTRWISRAVVRRGGIVMALHKHVLVLALLTMCVLAVGCAEDAAAPEQEDEAPILAPTNVHAIVISGGNIQISWDPSSQPTVLGYNVYRLDWTDETIERLNSSLLEVTSIVDGSSRIGREYEYRVTAVGTRSRESAFAAVMIRNQVPNRKDGRPGEFE